MNKERLLKLADFLDTLDPNRFYYGSFVGDDWQGRPDLSCGTTACAVGWASTLDIGVPKMVKARAEDGHGFYEKYGFGDDLACGFEAAKAAFDISSGESYYLFAPNERLGPHSSASDISNHIRAFVNSDGAIAMDSE